MRILVPAIVTATLINSPVSAQGVELWRGLSVGMTKAQAKTTMPENDFDLFAGCRVNVHMRFPNGKLDSLTIRQKWTMQKTDCAEAIGKTLLEKYGQPERDVVSTDAIGTYVKAKVFDVYLWKSGDIVIEYREEVGGVEWSLTYRPPYGENVVPTIDGL